MNKQNQIDLYSAGLHLVHLTCRTDFELAAYFWWTNDEGILACATQRVNVELILY